MLDKIEYKNNQLYFDNVNLNDIIKNYPTPIYIYSKDKIIENYNNYDSNFKKNNIENYTICYAVKANENLHILKLIASLGAGADTVSGNEIKKALLAGFPHDKILYSGVGKTNEELRYAIEKNIAQINIESREEFFEIEKIVNETKKIANISIRINPDIEAGGHEKISTGKKENKFGVSINIVKEILEKTKGNNLLNFKGLTVHIGSQILDINKFELTFKYLADIYKDFPEWTTIDLGGGLGIQYNENEKSPQYEDFAKLIKKYFNNSNLKILIEPGRSIVGDAGIFLSKTTYLKKTETKNFLVIEGGMNNLMRPALYDAYHHPLLVNIENQEKEIYDIVGPICESSDVFVKNLEMNKVEKENAIAFLSAGAYGRSMASNYNLHNIAGELMIENGKIKLIRKEISFEDLLKFEE